ncbi:MAG: molybdopterin-binding protein [Deinococcales bacterium]
MIAECLSVGTELLLGEIVDTNSAWLAADLAKRGVDVYWSQRVGDNLKRIVQALQEATNRSDLIIMCGGLGPTEDDMSREAIATLLHEKPYVDAQLEVELRDKFARFSRVMPESNLKQAWLIPSAEALTNPNGTAPGWFVRFKQGEKQKIIIALPGPPRELMPMWLNESLPKLELPQSVFYSTIFKTYSLGESHIAELLKDWESASANPSVDHLCQKGRGHVRSPAKPIA